VCVKKVVYILKLLQEFEAVISGVETKVAELIRSV